MKRMFVVAVVVLGACGDDGEAPVDGSPNNDAPAIDASIDGAPGRKEGQVFVAETPIIPIAMAMFVNGPLYTETGTAGPCFVGADNPATSLDAGSVMITGTTSTVALAPDDPGDVYTPTTQLPNDLFTAGATVTATASGATVPAFTGTVTAPARLGGLVPPTAYSRSSATTLTWTAGTGDAMWLLFTSTGGSLLCRVPDTGSYAVPGAAFALLPTQVTQVSLIAYRVNEAEVQAGAWTVTLRAADGISSAQVPLSP